MAMFLDDGLGGGVIIVKAKINSLIVHADLTRYGFIINEDKSLWEPVQILPGLALYLILIEVLSRLLKVGFLNLRVVLSVYAKLIVRSSSKLQILPLR